MPPGVSVRDGHVCASAGFARLADSSTARIRPPLPASRGARHAKRDVEVCECSVATGFIARRQLAPNATVPSTSR